LVDLATASESRRALILRRSGMSQTAIASRLGVSRYRVRQYLAA
jgi:predicted transcriptional regulator